MPLDDIRSDGTPNATIVSYSPLYWLKQIYNVLSGMSGGGGGTTPVDIVKVGSITVDPEAHAIVEVYTGAGLATGTNPAPVANSTVYEAVGASATNQSLGATGAAGDYLAAVLIQPGTTSPGNVIVKDGSTTIYTFPGGASSVATLHPFVATFGAKSVSGAWNITTGTNVTAVAVGVFT